MLFCIMSVSVNLFGQEIETLIFSDIFNDKVPGKERISIPILSKEQRLSNKATTILRSYSDVPIEVQKCIEFAVIIWESNIENSQPLKIKFEYADIDEDILLEFESIEQYSRLKIEEVSDIRYQFESDEDMIKVKSSVIELVLVSSMLANNTVKEIALKDGTEKNCAAAKIILENGQIIFLDPGFVHGIGIGGREQEKYWCYCKSF